MLVMLSPSARIAECNGHVWWFHGITQYMKVIASGGSEHSCKRVL